MKVGLFRVKGTSDRRVVKCSSNSIVHRLLYLFPVSKVDVITSEQVENDRVTVTGLLEGGYCTVSSTCPETTCLGRTRILN